MIKLLLPAGFLAVFSLSAFVVQQADGKVATKAKWEPMEPSAWNLPEPGSFPAAWIAGLDCEADPPIQVHAYNDDLYILRQSKCKTFEAPFLYLLFGRGEALLLDTGATPTVDVAATVNAIVASKTPPGGTIHLTVAHTHGHFDHVAADAQFAGNPNTTLVGITTPDVHQFWGFTSWPDDVVTYDLGGRILDVLATPGHHPDSVTVYDRRTQLLLTGDIVYPGHLFIFSPLHVGDFTTSLQRLTNFAVQNPVSFVLGCHIEMSDTPFGSYAYGTSVHPDEHVLQFPPTILGEILQASIDLGPDPECTIFDEFVIHPVYKCGIQWNGD